MSSRELVKLYYRIGEVASLVGVQPHVLRYWETEFRTIRPQKSHKGQRVYSRKDVEKLLRVKDLLKNQGFTIAGAKKKLREPTEVGVETEAVAAPAPAIVAPEAPAAGASSGRVRDALLTLREEIVSMMDDLEAPVRRPKLPTIT